MLRNSFLAEDNGSGQPTVDATLAFNDGDLAYNIDWTPGTFLGWIYESGTWYKFGLSDTAPITSNRFAGVTNYGIGEAPDANNRFRITGNIAVTGDIDVSGKYGCADKYSLATGVNSGNNGVMYTGNGNTTSFAISPGHTAYSLLVFLNGVCQRPGTDYTVNANSVDFSIGTTPQTGDNIQIRELVI